jgi:hypothetical protein
MKALLSIAKLDSSLAEVDKARPPFRKPVRRVWNRKTA